MGRNVLRPMDAQFPEAFVEHGHDRIHEELFGAAWQTIQAWIDQLPAEVIDAREDYLRRTRWPNGRPGPPRKARRYVMGQTLTRKMT